MKAWRQISQIALRGLLAAMLFGMSDGHWAVLQSLAWTRMIVNYSRSAPLYIAIEETFDGHHPCALCKFVQKAQQSSQRTELQQTRAKYDAPYWDFWPACVVDLPCAWRVADALGVPLSRSDPPPVPPPRPRAA